METIKITVHSGINIEGKCNNQMHPLNEVKNALRLINLNRSFELYSNSPDFIMAIKYIGQERGITTEFILDGVSYGNDIEPTFKSFNQSLDLLNELTPNVK